MIFLLNEKKRYIASLGDYCHEGPKHHFRMICAMLKPLLRGGSCKTLLCAIVATICAFCAQAQTTLYPGDIIVSMLTADVSGGNKIEGHVGFVLLRDVEEGTTLTIRKDVWLCDEAGSCGWADTSSPQRMT